MNATGSSPPNTRSRAASTRLAEAGGDCNIDAIVEAIIAGLHASGLAAVTAVASELAAAELAAAPAAVAGAARPAAVKLEAGLEDETPPTPPNSALGGVGAEIIYWYERPGTRSPVMQTPDSSLADTSEAAHAARYVIGCQPPAARKSRQPRVARPTATPRRRGSRGSGHNEQKTNET